MKKKKLTAILLSAVLAFSACMPLSGISTAASEETGVQTVEDSAEEVKEESAADREILTGEEGTAAEKEIPAGEEDSADSASEQAAEAEIASTETDDEENGPSETEEKDPAPVMEEADPVQDGEQEMTEAPESAAPVTPAADGAGGTEDAGKSQEADQPADGTVPDGGEEKLTSEPENVDGTGEPVNFPEDSDAKNSPVDVNSDGSAEEKASEEAVDTAVPGRNDFKSAETIEVGNTFDVEVTENAPYALFKLIPQEDAFLTLSSSSNVDTWVTLFDESGVELAYNDDGGGENSADFRLSRQYYAGETYYFCTNIYGLGAGSFSVTLAATDFYVDNGGMSFYSCAPGGSVEIGVFAVSDTPITYRWYAIDSTGKGNDLLLQEGDSDKLVYQPDHRTDIRCQITDESGNEGLLYFTACVEQNWSADVRGDFRIVVEQGQSAEAQVDVSCFEGFENLYQFTYVWYDQDGNLLKEGADSSYTIEEVSGPIRVDCNVKDQYENCVDIPFLVYNTGYLNIYANGREGVRSDTYYCNAGDSVSFYVTDGTNGMSPITYTWYDENGEVLDDSNSYWFEIPYVQKDYVIRCHGEDQDGNSADLYFYVFLYSYLTAYADGYEEGTNQVSIDILGKDTLDLGTVAYNSVGRDITYQWEILSADPVTHEWPDEEDDQWTEIPGADSDSYQVRQPQIYDRYRCRVLDEAGNSAFVYFYLDASTCFEARPDEFIWSDTRIIYVDESEEAVLAPYVYSVDPARVTFLWARLDGDAEELIEGETASTYTVSNPQAGDSYVCTVGDGYGYQIRLYYQFLKNNNLFVYTDESESTYKEIDPRSAETFTLTPVVSATDMSELRYSWAMRVNDEADWEQLGSEPSLTIDHQPVSGTSYKCTVADQYANSGEAFYRFQIQTNLKAFPEGRSEDDRESWIVIGGQEEIPLTAVVKADPGTGISWRWEHVGSDDLEDTDAQGSSDNPDGSFTVSRTVSNPRDGDEYCLYVEDEYRNSVIVTFYFQNDPLALEVWPSSSCYNDLEDGICVVHYDLYNNEIQLSVGIPSYLDVGSTTFDWRDPNGDSLEDAEQNSVIISDFSDGEQYSCKVTDIYGQTQTAVFRLLREWREEDPSEEDFRSAANISVGKSVKVNVTAENPVAWFKFVPEKDGSYEFYAESEDYIDSYATLYNAQGMILTTADGGADKGHFSIRSSFRAGKTYYLGVKEYYYGSASFTLHLLNGEISEWLSDYSFRIEDDSIILNDYMGSDTEISVPGSATARGHVYPVRLGGEVWYQMKEQITSISLGKGARLSEYSGYLFREMSSLTSVDLAGADVSQVQDGVNLFEGCSRLQTIKAPAGLSSNVILPRIFVDGEGNRYTSLPKNLSRSITLTKIHESDWLSEYLYDCTEDEIVLTSYTGSSDEIDLPGSAEVGEKTYNRIRLTDNLWGWSNIRTMTFAEGVLLPEDCSGIFSSSALESIDLSRIDMSNVTEGIEFFGNGVKLQTIRTPKKVAVEITLPAAFADPEGKLYSALPQNQVESMTLTRAAVSSWLADYSYRIDEGAGKVCLLSYLGSNSTVTVPGSASVGGIAFQNVELSPGMWKQNGFRINKVSFEAGVLVPADCTELFCGLSDITTIDVSGLDWSGVTSMQDLFGGCWSLKSIKLTGMNTGNVLNMGGMFRDCDKLTQINLSGFTTSKVVSMERMFAGCDSLTALDLSKFDTSQVTDMSDMFYGCGHLTQLDLKNFNTENVTDMSDMFDYCWNLTSLDLGGWDASAVTDMNGMFSFCYVLKSLNLSGIRAENVTDMASMFRDCEELTEIDLSSFHVAAVTNVSSMFRGCIKLQNLNLDNFDASAVEHAGRMFSEVSKLATITTPKNLQKVIYLPAVYERTNGALYGTLPRAESKYLVLNYARNLLPGESGDPVPAAGVTLSKTEFTYTGSARTPQVTVMSGDRKLTAGTDYTITFTNNINAGTAKVTVTGKGTFTGTVTKNFTISRAAIPANGVTLASTSVTYNGKAQTPAVTVKSGSKTLKSGKDYTAAYSNNTKAGTASVTVTGKGNYSGSVKKTFTIAKAAQNITAKAGAVRVAVGKTTAVTVSGTKESAKLTYKTSSSAIATVNTKGTVKGVKVGTATITVTTAATANYKATSKTVTVKIVPAATAGITAANLAKGIKLTWKKVTGANGYIIYRNNTKVKTINSGATLTWTDTGANTNGTKYVHKVVAKGSTGTSTLSKSLTTYRVAQPKISSLANSASKKMTVKWGRNTKANGYEIQYGLTKNFSGAKAVTITQNATVFRVIGSLTKGKTYYVRIRTYKTVGGKKYYSIWSAARTVKITK